MEKSPIGGIDVRREDFVVTSNREIARDICEMRLSGNTTAISAPGQFVNLRIDGLYLRRPISVCDWETGAMTLIYKVVGEGTARLAERKPGEVLDVLVGLGNGYDLHASGDRPLLIGGGAGVPPLYGLARRLIQQGRSVQVLMGFASAREAFYVDAFRALGADAAVATADGSLGAKGFVTDILPAPDAYTHVYVCGPEAMLKAVWQCAGTSGQFSFEERMGCGFGACMGCSCKTKYGAKRICKDGPVLRKEEIVW